MTWPVMLVLLSIAAPVPQEPPPASRRYQLFPVDDGSKDTSFLQFRERLLKALKERDVNFVISVLDPAIRCSLGGGDGGPQEFRDYWKLQAPGTSELWRELTTVLSMGGKLDRLDDHLQFTAPYTFSHYPQHFDAFESLAIIRPRVNLRARPNLTSPVVTALDYDVVHTVDNWRPEVVWTRVRTPEGRTGYVMSRYLRSAIDYRAMFSNAGGRWRMTMLIAGD